MNYFEHLCEISRAQGAAIKKRELLDLLMDIAVDALDARGACLCLMHPENSRFLPAVHRGLSEKHLQAEPDRAKAILEELLKSGCRKISDIIDDDCASHPGLLAEEGIASYMAVPVMTGNQPMGVFFLYKSEKHEFGRDEIAFFSALAANAGIAVDRARLIVHIRKMTKMFHDLTAGINASLDLKQIMNTLTVDLTRGYGAKGAAVYLVDRKTGEPVLVTHHGLSPDILAAAAVAGGIRTRDILTGKTLILPNDHMPVPEALQQQGVMGLMGAPIRSGEDISGMMWLYFAAYRPFYDDEIMMFNALAHQAGLSIGNATSFAILEDKYSDLKDDMWAHRSWF